MSSASPMPDAVPLAFVDTETTSLRPDRRAWDVALIVRPAGGSRADDVEHTWLVDAEDLDLGNADPFALRVGHFYERHPQFMIGEHEELVSATLRVEDEDDAMRHVEFLTRGAHLVGMMPNFDAEVLGARMRAHGLLPAWHYHLVDVETLAVGWLQRKVAESRQRFPGDAFLDVSLPWKSDEVSRAVGVEPPGEADRHTALGDARWARDLFDAIMGGVL